MEANSYGSATPSLWREDLLVVAVLAVLIGADRFGLFVVPEEEVVVAPAAERTVRALSSRADPSRPPEAMREDCLRSGRWLVATRADGRPWTYDCVEPRR